MPVAFSKHQHAAVIGGHQFGRRLLAGGEGDQDRRRLLREVERARQDIAVGRDHEAGGGPIGEQRAFDDIQPADGADLHDGRGDVFRGGVEGGFFAGGERVRCPAQMRRQQLQIAKCKLQNENCGIEPHTRLAMLHLSRLSSRLLLLCVRERLRSVLR